MAFFVFLLAMEALCLSAGAQTLIQGKVSSSDGAPLVGATVALKGSNKGTVTDAEGSFSLSAAIGDKLTVSYIGFQSKEVVISSKYILISLSPAGKTLNSVVVTALGINREKRSLGYSVGEVKGDELSKVPHESAVDALAGKVAGLRISNTSNTLSSVPQVVIRGAKSLSGNDAPLIIIDGIPTGNDAGVLADLNPDNIASVSVLKGPSAAALYGSRAGNGVLLVTTKDGKGQKGIGVSVNSSYTSKVPYSFIPLQQEFAGGINGLFDPNADQQRWGPAMGTLAVLPNSDGQKVPLKGHPNNMKDFFNVGHTFQNDVSVYGANDRGSFNLSLSDTRAKGTYPGTELRKDAVALSASHDITRTFRVSAHAHLLTSGSDNSRAPSSTNKDFYSLTYFPNWLDINDWKDYWSEEGIQQNVWSSRFDNPWFDAYVNLRKFKRFRAYGNIKFDWDISKDFSLMARASTFNDNYTLSRQYGKSDLHYPNGRYLYQSTYTNELNTDFLLTYKKQVGDFSIDASGGGNLLFQNTNGSVMFGDKLVLPGLYTASNIDRSAVTYRSAFTKKRINSLYGTASFNYKDEIYLDLTARNDWSSTLPVNNRSYFYPSASLSFILSDILHLPDFISLLKLRGGWASVGKDTKPYQLDQYMDKSNWGNQVTYSLPNTMANTTLEPEKVVSKEVGIDVNLFKDRISFNGTYYQIEDRNQIMGVSTPALTGFLQASVNAGVVRNQGVELVLHGIPVKTNTIRWDVNFEFTKNHSTLVKLPEGVDVFQFWENTQVFDQTTLNGTIGDLWGNDVVRVKEGPYKGWPLLNSNGYLQRDPNLKKMGNVNAKFILGFQSSVSIRRFTISANFTWRNGGDYYSKTMLRLSRGGRQESWYKGPGSSTFTGILSAKSFDGSHEQLAAEIKNNPGKYNGMNGAVWVGGRTQELGGFPLASSNIDNGAFFPGVRSDGQGGYIENFGGPQTKYFRTGLIVDPGAGWWSQGVQTWIYDASFIKLRELSIAYSFPKSIAESIKAQDLSLSLFMRNLIVWTKAKNHIDPEMAYTPDNLSYETSDDTGTQNFFREGEDDNSHFPWTVVTGLRLSLRF